MHEQKNAKADGLIESGLGALREERAPAHDAEAVVSELRRPRAPRRGAVAVAAVVVALAVGAVVFSPREGVAADLRDIDEAIQKMPPRQETHYVLTDDGDYVVSMHLVVNEDEALLVEDTAATLHWKANRLVTAHEEYATVQNAPPPDWTSKTFILSSLLRHAVDKSITRKLVPQQQASFEYKIDPGRTIERIEFDVRLDDALARNIAASVRLDNVVMNQVGHVKLDIDKATLRPLLVEAKLAHDMKIAFEYVVRDIDVKLVQNVVDFSNVKLAWEPAHLSRSLLLHVYDIDAQRQEIVNAFAAPIASVEVEGQKVLLHAAVLDHDGNLTFIYSDTDALPANVDKSRVVAKDMQEAGATLELMPQIHQDGTLHLAPILHEGHKIAVLSVRVKKPEKADAGPKTLNEVNLPVAFNGIVRWAKFTDVPYMLTGNSLTLLAPENVPFWIKKVEEGAPTKKG